MLGIIFFKTLYNKTIIGLGFCDILNNQGLGKCYQSRPLARLITLTSTLISDITKTSSNNVYNYFKFVSHLLKVRKLVLCQIQLLNIWTGCYDLPVRASACDTTAIKGEDSLLVMLWLVKRGCKLCKTEQKYWRRLSDLYFKRKLLFEVKYVLKS